MSSWGFEGMLAAIDRGYGRDWCKLVSAVAAHPELLEQFEEACDAAESRATVALVTEMLHQATMTPSERAIDRLRDA